MLYPSRCGNWLLHLCFLPRFIYVFIITTGPFDYVTVLRAPEFPLGSSRPTLLFRSAEHLLIPCCLFINKRASTAHPCPCPLLCLYWFTLIHNLSCPRRIIPFMRNNYNVLSCSSGGAIKCVSPRTKIIDAPPPCTQAWLTNNLLMWIKIKLPQNTMNVFIML